MSEDVPFTQPHFGPSHYYGDYVRVLFVVAAVLILGSQFIKAPFLTPVAALIFSVVLVLAAGLTSPVLASIQWINVVISGLALFFFGSIALTRYQETHSIYSGSNLVIIILTIIFMVALYLATRTLRGTLMRGAPIIR